MAKKKAETEEVTKVAPLTTGEAAGWFEDPAEKTVVAEAPPTLADDVHLLQELRKQGWADPGEVAELKKAASAGGAAGMVCVCCGNREFKPAES